MRIATYNVWNSGAGMPMRFRQLAREITGTHADILCLQEVANRETHHALSSLCGDESACWQAQTGLSILSWYPLDKGADFEYGTSALIHGEGKTLLVVNVHLPWEKASLREMTMVEITGAVSDVRADYTLMMGDFNSSASSSVHRFLTNEQSLLGADAYYFDLAEAFAQASGTTPCATLNFRENPRWGVVEPPNTIEANQRCDWILLKNPYPAPLPALKRYMRFGTEISPETGLAASDHYGILVEMDF